MRLVTLILPVLLGTLAPALAAQPKTRLIFDLDQGFGNGIVVNDDQVALGRVIDALKPLRERYDVYVIVNPMVADRKKLDHVLDTLAAADQPFVFDTYTSDAETLGSCSTQNRPFDPRHGLTISVDDLAAYKKRRGKHLAGLRFMEVFAQDFTVRAVKTTNPEWALPCWKLPDDAFFQPEIAERYLKFAKEHSMFVQWSDWHWFEFASWDAVQKEHEAKLSELLRKYPGLVTITYANNEPEEASVQRIKGWEKSVAGFAKDGAAGYGLSDQSWLSKNDETCPVDDIIRWAKSALAKGCRMIQFEPAWYFFRLPRGTFDVREYTSDPKWADRGSPTANFTRLKEALMYGEALNTREDGYRGIWYANQPSKDEYVYKYSGGMATYTAYHIPIAVYSEEADKTFFVYGGMRDLKSPKLLIMAGYYDHKTGKVPKPTLILEKETGGDGHDAHHNPALSIDDKGYLWVFAPSHGGKDGFVYKSRKPYSTDAFDLVMQREFSYPEPWYFPGFGHMFLFTRYTHGRELYMSTSPDGINWTQDRKIAGFAGHYQVSWAQGKKRGTAFNWHPPVGGLNARTNLYYMETSDFGATWADAAGKPLKTPLDAVINGALVRDYQKEGKLVYIQDMVFDRQGRPAILYILSKGYESGPKNGPRTWVIAHWTGEGWDFRKITESDHNYDTGSIYIEDDGLWRVIGPTAPGPQPHGTGGDIEVWDSRDQGKTWARARQLTSDSRLNHSFVRRPVNAHPDFYALWADGNPFEPSECRIYFTNKSMDKVWMLPEKMESDFASPIPVSPGFIP